MSDPIYSKMIISGKYVEYYEFQNPISTSPRDVDRSKKEDTPDWKKIDNRRVSLLRTAKKLKRLIYCNPTMYRFLTLTYAGNYSNIKSSNKQFNLFAKRLRYKYPDIKYIAVIEFQKRGAIHYHLLVDRYIPHSVYKELWTHGFVFIEKIYDLNGVLYYLQKYMRKINPSDRRLWGSKLYFTSRNLDKPLEYNNVDYSDIDKVVNKIIHNDIYHCRIKDYQTFTSTYYSDYLGKVSYWAFNLS